jgi:hypothetical protein
MTEEDLHAKTTFRKKGAFLSATPYLQKFDFLIEEVIWKNLYRKDISGEVF